MGEFDNIPLKHTEGESLDQLSRSADELKYIQGQNRQVAHPTVSVSQRIRLPVSFDREFRKLMNWFRGFECSPPQCAARRPPSNQCVSTSTTRTPRFS